ncbi:MAG: ATP-binding protein, partial [Candidatus Obscuribacterales bacterium]|nr:ATP-binding protein [Candidatus Obscuribacterales bacterium]
RSIKRDELILPESVLEQIDHHTSKISLHRQILTARGQHLKRGLLLYGPPGTGKSMTIRHLIGIMPERTTVLLSGNSVKHLETACGLARALQPATVVIDDVDLVAEERSGRNANPLLFELLNQMDGVGDDADLLFLLTTNRPEAIESAIAARPGRIDHAVLVPLPDDDCRARLFKLYGRGLPILLSDESALIERTAGASAAFIREMFRKAAVYALEDGADARIQDRHFEKAFAGLRACLTGRLFAFAADT